MVHEYVSRLRTGLAEVSQIATRPPGYVLESAGEGLDAPRVREAHHDGPCRGRRPPARGRAASRTIRRSRSGAGMRSPTSRSKASAITAATRLDQERQLVGEERIDCALALGQHQQLIPELEHRVEEAPLRERSRAQLMLALYRSGRQTEALDRYREGRALLVEHAGVEPGRELRELERAILTQDPALDAPDGGSRGGRPRPDAGRRSPVVASRAGAGGGWWSRPSCWRRRSGFSYSRWVALIPPTHSLGSTPTRRGRSIPGTTGSWIRCAVGTGPGRIAAGFGSLWVVNDFDNTVSRIDPASGERADDPGRRRSDRDRGGSRVRVGRVHRHAKRRSDRPAAEQARRSGYRSETVRAGSRSARAPCG